jgi:hypothetical protein
MFPIVEVKLKDYEFEGGETIYSGSLVLDVLANEDTFFSF